MNLNKGLKPVALLCSSALHLLANAKDIDAEIEVNLPVVEVQAESLQQRVYTREDMDALPLGNRDITSLIEDNPAVRLNPSVSSSVNRGSLAPESFSIHGESPYQNKFLIDGVGVNNIVNPNENSDSAGFDKVQGFSQAYNLDTDLLDSVRVHESKIPVEFSGFLGGVVDAKIKDPKGDGSWKLKSSFNSSNLTQQKIASGQEESWELGKPGYTPEWKKKFFSIQGDIKINADSAALLAFSKRKSGISRKSLVLNPSNGLDRVLRESITDDEVVNFFSKINMDIGGGLVASTLIKYADRKQDLVSNTFNDFGWSTRQKAYGVSFDLLKRLNYGLLKTNFGYDKMANLQESDSNEFVTQAFASKSLGTAYTYGGYGNNESVQKQSFIKLRMDWNALSLGEFEHAVYAGLEYKNTKADFTRKSDSYSYVKTLSALGVQKESNKTLWKAGTADVDSNQYGLYINDDVSWRQWSSSLGIRLDHEDLLRNFNFSPRVRVGYDFFENKSSVINFGWARYYGMDMLGFAMQSQKNLLKVGVLDANGNPTKPVVAEKHSFNDVKTPYSDEWSLGWAKRLNSYLNFDMNYVHRIGRDGVTRQGDSTSGYFYNNSARSKSETLSLGISSSRSIYFIGANWSGRADWSLQDLWRNHNVFDSWSSDDDAYGDSVVFDGKKINRDELPATEFNMPHKVALSTSAQWSRFGIVWGNRLQWMSSRDGIQILQKKDWVNGMQTWRSQKIPSTWKWDTSVTWKPRGVQGLNLNLEILNLLNKIKKTAISGTDTELDNNGYQIGREIWINIGYEF